MKKDKIIVTLLKLFALTIIGIGIWNFYDYRLWEEVHTDFGHCLQIFLPILALGFSGTLYGIAILIEKSNYEK